MFKRHITEFRWRIPAKPSNASNGRVRGHIPYASGGGSRGDCVSSDLLLPRFGVRIDHAAGLVLGRQQDHLFGAGTELLEIVRGDVLKLREELPRFSPLTVHAECNVPDDCLERVGVDVGGELVIIGVLGCFHRMSEHLPRRIAERHEAVAERIDALAGRFGLVAVEQIGDAGEFERRRAHKAFADTRPLASGPSWTLIGVTSRPIMAPPNIFGTRLISFAARMMPTVSGG